MLGKFTVDIQITDPARLHATAFADYLSRNGFGTFDQATDFLGTSDHPKIDQCIRQLYDRPQDNCGFDIVDSNAVIGEPAPLRIIPMVAMSTAHISPDELKRINDAFELEPSGHTHRALEDINHDGLYMSPKDSGFIVRIPCDEMIDEVRPKLSPDMLAIVDLARAQGADRIEFDLDEPEVDQLTIHEY